MCPWRPRRPPEGEIRHPGSKKDQRGLEACHDDMSGRMRKKRVGEQSQIHNGKASPAGDHAQSAPSTGLLADFKQKVRSGKRFLENSTNWPRH